MKKIIIAVISVCALLLCSGLSVLNVSAAEKYDAGGSYSVVGNDLNDGGYIVASVNVKDYGAKGDGKTDDTAAIKEAFSAMVFGAKAGTIYFPAGKYRVTSPGFTVLSGCSLVGQRKDPDSSDKEEGTVIIADYINKKDVPLFYMSECSALTDISVYYPRQKADKPIKYAPTIKSATTTREISNFVTVKNVTLYNSFDGIDIRGGAQHCTGIRGTVLNTGLHVSLNAEVSEFVDVKFSASYWNKYDGTSVEKIKAYTKANAIGFKIGYTDDYLMYNLSFPKDEFAKGIYYYADKTSTGQTFISYGLSFDLNGSEIFVEDGYEEFVPEGWPKQVNIDKVKNSDKYSFEEPVDRYSTKNTLFNVRSKTYGATGKGSKDDTQAFRKAIDDAKKNGGGIVFVPAGTYKITSSIVVPDNVEILGDWHGYRTGSPSVISVKYKTDEQNAAFVLGNNSGVQGLTFILPEHVPSVYIVPEGEEYGYANGKTYDVWKDPFPLESLTITEFPWLVKGDGKGCWVENICITNGFNGIDFASAKCDDFVINGVWGTCMNLGVKIGGGSENGRIAYTFFTYGTWWENIRRTQDLSLYSYRCSDGYYLGNCKNIKILSAATFGLHYGMRFYNDGTGAPENVSVLRMLADMPFGKYGILAEAGDDISIIGLSTGVNSTPDAGKISNYLYADENFGGKLRVYGQNYWGNTENKICGDVKVYGYDDVNTDYISHDFPKPDYYYNDNSSSEDNSGKKGCGASLHTESAALILTGCCLYIILAKKRKGEKI